MTNLNNIINLTSLVTEHNKTSPAHPIEIRENEPMSRHTTFKIGGNADLYLIPSDVEALASLCRMLKETEVRHFFLGNGSNVVFGDNGYRGAVVSLLSLDSINVNGNTITAGAGSPLIAVCKKARDESLTGMEFAYGIPGTVGGAVYMNAGAYDGDVSKILTESTCLDPADLSIHTLTADAHNFAYRDSVYQKNNCIILSAVFALNRGNQTEIAEKMNGFMQRRIDKQPLEYPSAGSAFRRYPGHYTGQMIEECGLKGYTVGGVQVSEKHAGFIINRGGATAEDLDKLIAIIKDKVYEKFGCKIQCELIRVE